VWIKVAAIWPCEGGVELDLTPQNSPREDIVSVSRLLRSARDLIERRFPLLWVSGEICDVKPARSGHLYFVLKDEQAQVDCVMFRSRAMLLDWTPREGMRVEVRALVTLYEPRGRFQLTIEGMRQGRPRALFTSAS
jgi:exodeoxyribonuclease VII large subunit